MIGTATIGSFTKTETLRRLRVGSKLFRRAEFIPQNWRAELGTRTYLQTRTTAIAAANLDDYPDLDDCWDLPGASRLDDVRTFGYIAHIYLYEPQTVWGDGGYLYDVQCVWMGTPDAEPVLLHRTKGLIRDADTK